MRSLGTSDRPSVRAVSAAIEKVSSRTRARQFVRVMNRMGASPAAILPFVQDSPNFRNRRFEGEEPSLRPRVKAQTSALLAAIRVHGRGEPVGTVPVVPADPPREPGALAVTWYGHATCVLELDGARFLIDPVFSERVSPIRHSGPKRHAPGPGRDRRPAEHRRRAHQPRPLRPPRPALDRPAGGDPPAALRRAARRQRAPAGLGRARGAHHGPRLARRDRGRRHPADLHRGPAQLRPRPRRQPDPLGRAGRCTAPRTRRTSPATPARRSASPRSAPTSARST